jgi:glycosyltransferase involved in cell wall biosynthesis
MNRFVFIAPTYNAEKTCGQAILSLAAQSYKNWHLIMVDDMSTDYSVANVKSLFNALGISDRLTVIENTEKKWEVANVLEALKHCQEDDIVCRFDLDDYLIDTQALEIIDMQYRGDKDLEALWTAHRWFDKNGTTNRNISAPLADNVDVYKHPWVSSHLKTFRKRVIDNVNDANFRGPDGEYIRRAGDQAIFLPVLHKAKKKGYLPMAMYAYRCDMNPQTFQTDDAKFQKSEAEFLRARGFVE